VLLRPLQKEDHSLLLPFALNEPDLWKYSLVSAARDEGLAYYMQLALDARKEQKEYPFIVFDKVKKNLRGAPGL
jgi:hypothetical protein